MEAKERKHKLVTDQLIGHMSAAIDYLEGGSRTIQEGTRLQPSEPDKQHLTKAYSQDQVKAFLTIARDRVNNALTTLKVLETQRLKEQRSTHNTKGK